MALMTEQEGLDEMKKIIRKGEVFGVSAVQRHLRWGFNRAYRAVQLAVETGQAVYADDEECRVKFK